MLKQYKLKDYNFRLILWLGALSALGILLVGSAESTLQTRQLGGVLLGVAVMIVLSLTDFSWIMNFYNIIYIANIVARRIDRRRRGGSPFSASVFSLWSSPRFSS